ncbi:RNA-dependent RNA polymerase, partial [Actinidia chinensis var. chinensis]
MGKTIQLSGFPHLVPGETVKEFLEKHTGRGTVEALEVREPKRTGSRAYAIVQFTTARYADYIVSLASGRFYYGTSYLKAYPKDFDLVQKPKAYAHDMESVTLHFGCQISKVKFSVLWEKEDVTVKFGFGLRKMYFFFSYLFVDYKLELSYENIWQLELHRPHGQTLKFLLIQVS